MAKQEQREIALNFITNAEETKSKVDALLNSLDKTDDSYAELEQQSASLESAIIDVNNAMNNSTGSSNILQNSIKKLEGETTKATTSLNNVKKATDNQAKASNNLTKEVTANGGAMAILDTLTGGLASQFKNAYEATGLFTAGTNLASIAQRAFTAVVGTSTGALKAFRIALAATGIGVAIVLIGFLVEAYMNLSNATDEATESQRKLNAEMANNQYEETLSRMEYLAQLSRDQAREQGASIAQIRDLERDVANERLKELDRRRKDERLTSEQVKKAGEAYLQQQRKINLQEARWRAEDAESSRNLDKQRSSERVALAQKTSAQLLKIEEDRIRKVESILSSTQDSRLAKAIEQADTINKLLGTNFDILKDLTSKSLDEITDEVEKSFTLINNEIEKTTNVRLRSVLRDLAKELSSTYDSLIKDFTVSSDIPSVFGKSVNKVLNDALNVGSDLGEIYKATKESLLSLGGTMSSFDYNLMLEEFNRNLTLILDQVAYPENGETVFEHLKDDFLGFEDAIREGIKGVMKDIEEYNKDSELINEALKPFISIDSLIKEENEKTEKLLEILQERRDKGILAETEYLNLRKALLKLNLDEIEEIRKDHNRREEEEEERRLNRKRANQEAEEAIVAASANAQAAHLDMVLSFMSDEEAERAKSTDGYKTLAIATATMDTYAAAISGYRSAMAMFSANPIVGNIVGIASIATAISTGIAQINAIRKVKVPGGGSGGGGSISASAGATPNVSFVSSSENQIANSVNANTNAQNQEPIKAYVVTGDINTSQSLERNKIESNSI